jgi:2,4-dienoyl-CoA reductase-like NADH-dependent reductase (Old Yellow Enzyme family)
LIIVNYATNAGLAAPPCRSIIESKPSARRGNSMADVDITPTGPGRIAGFVRRFERGDFDLISIGRSLIGDPDWGTKMRDGRGPEVRPFRRADLEWLS